MVMVRAGPFKFIHSEPDPPLLFNLLNDPEERRSLVEDPVHVGLVERFRVVIGDRWDLAAIRDDVLASQARRRIVYEALRNGSYYPWDFQPLQKASERYMRNHMDLNELEERSRFQKRRRSGRQGTIRAACSRFPERPRLPGTQRSRTKRKCSGWSLYP
jgi:choline-sulfatase